MVVDRNNKPPIWDQQNYGPIYVKENAAVGSIVTSVKARFVLGLRHHNDLERSNATLYDRNYFLGILS